MLKLTDKQKRFVDEYLIDLNATQAYKRAGYSVKSDNAAAVEGLKLLRNPKIERHIAERLKQFEDENTASLKEILEYLTAAMRGEIVEAVVLAVGCGGGKSKAIVVYKQISAKDSLRAAELLGKRYGLFKNNVNLEFDSPQVIIIDDIS